MRAIVRSPERSDQTPARRPRRYQAIEQGFYRDAGLDVAIREGGPDIDVSEVVADGRADFGVCSASILPDWAAGRRLVVLAGSGLGDDRIAQRDPCSECGATCGPSIAQLVGHVVIPLCRRRGGVCQWAPALAHAGPAGFDGRSRRAAGGDRRMR